MEENKEINKYIEFIDKIFERATDPIEQLQRIFENHPLIFFIKEVCNHINERLVKVGYKLNMDYIKEVKNIHYSCSNDTRNGCSRGKNGCGTGRGSCSDYRRRNDDDYMRMSSDKEYGLFIALES